MNSSKHLYVVPDVLKRNALALIKVSFEIRHPRLGVNYPTLSVELFHPLLAKAPGPSDTFPFEDWVALDCAARTGYVRFVVAATAAVLDVAIPLVHGCLRQRRILHVPCLILRHLA